MKNDDEDAKTQSGTVAKAKIENLRVKAPADDGASFQIDLLLHLENRGSAILSLTRDDILQMLDLANEAISQGQNHPN